MRRSHHGGAVVGLLAAALVAGAGVGFRRSSPPPARHLPSTGAARSPSRCPAAPGETVETGYVGRDSDLLLANRAVVEQYGRSHASEFGGYQFVAGPPELLRVAFTAHTDQHLADLRARVPFPDRLDVVSTDHTVVELGSIREQLAIDLSRPQRGDVYDSLSLGWQAVDVGLRAGMEDLALTARRERSASSSAHPAVTADPDPPFRPGDTASGSSWRRRVAGDRPSCRPRPLSP